MILNLTEAECIDLITSAMQSAHDIEAEEPGSELADRLKNLGWNVFTQLKNAQAAEAQQELAEQAVSEGEELLVRGIGLVEPRP